MIPLRGALCGRRASRRSAFDQSSFAAGRRSHRAGVIFQKWASLCVGGAPRAEVPSIRAPSRRGAAPTGRGLSFRSGLLSVWEARLAPKCLRSKPFRGGAPLPQGSASTGQRFPKGGAPQRSGLSWGAPRGGTLVRGTPVRGTLVRRLLLCGRRALAPKCLRSKPFRGGALLPQGSGYLPAGAALPQGRCSHRSGLSSRGRPCGRHPVRGAPVRGTLVGVGFCGRRAPAPTGLRSKPFAAGRRSHRAGVIFQKWASLCVGDAPRADVPSIEILSRRGAAHTGRGCLSEVGFSLCGRRASRRSAFDQSSFAAGRGSRIETSRRPSPAPAARTSVPAPDAG